MSTGFHISSQNELVDKSFQGTVTFSDLEPDWYYGLSLPQRYRIWRVCNMNARGLSALESIAQMRGHEPIFNAICIEMEDAPYSGKEGRRATTQVIKSYPYATWIASHV